jgi:hypothetical protein
VAGDAVAKIDSPGKIGGRAIGVVGKAGEKTSDAADGDAEGEGDGIEISGGLGNSDGTLDQFDGDQSAGERSDDGFAAEQVGGIMNVVPRERGVFEKKEQFRSEGCASYGCGNYGPAKRSFERIAEAAAEPQVDAGADEIGQRFEEEMRMDDVGAEVEVERKCGGGMDEGL